ncbi:MAG: alpha/beta fold hydrolase [Planctomycetes bacterium]|nr:alpha/beta fold hydrolase [Planctomycetota bacterium]
MTVAHRGSHHLRFAVEGDGPPLVLLPGLGSGARLFGTLPRRFARDGHRAITFDPVGIPPSSPLLGEYRFDEAARDVWAVADAADAERVDLVGTSLGGKLALAAAALAPERVRRIVLLASSAVPSARAARVYRFFETIAEHVPGDRFADAVMPFLLGRRFHEERPAVVDDIARATRPQPATRALMLQQARALQHYDGRATARAVRAPVLCIAGLDDTLTDARDVAATAALLEHGRYVEIAGAGHSLLLEDAEVYRQTIGFLCE